ncbi:hypothetical protein PFISCL1PPCAC_1404, partial [Pristionchus fissidentatus]
DDFVNFKSSALLLSNESTMCTPSDEFRIPAFIIMEELMKESLTGIISLKLRAFSIHLLRLVFQDNTISDTNYNDHLRQYLDRQYILPEEVRNPLGAEENFHSLPSGVKQWIFTSLIANCGRDFPIEQKSIGHDTLGNEYYLVNENYLYMKYGKPLQYQDREEENSMGDEYSLERYIHKQSSTNSWKLMAKSKKDLEFVGRSLKCFKEYDIAKSLLRKVEERNQIQV